MSGGPGHPQKPLAVFDLIYGRSDDDAIIAIGSRRPNRKGDVAPRYFYPLRVRDRHALLPTLFEYCIEQTQYLMPNTLHQRALMGKTDTFFREGLDREHPEYFQAKNRYVHELCAITIDLDVGRGEGLTAGQALGCVFDLCLNHKMVWPSLVALSGRGAYLMFLLRNENSISPPPNTDDNAACWKLIVNEMLHRLDSLSADPNAKRLANWFKRPGTIDTNTGNEVVYMTFGVNSLSNVPLYRLSHLMKVFGLHHEPDPMAIDVRPAQAKQLAPPTPTSIASQRSQRREPVRKVKAGKGGEPYKRRANEIELLSQHRKGIHEGLRTTTLFHYFQALRASLGMTYRSEPDGKARAHQKALAAALSLNQTFRPPLPDGEARKACAVKSGARMARSATVANDLMVREDEVNKLHLVSVVPLGIKNTQKTQERRRRDHERLYREKRRDLVDKLIAAGKDTASIIAAAQVEYPMMDKITRQFVYARRKKLEAEAPLEFFGGVE